MTRVLALLLSFAAASVALSAQAPTAPRPAPTPTPAPVLEGTVKGPDGRPVDKALILAEPVRSSFAFVAASAPVSTRTDASGRFKLALRERKPHTVRVEAPGLAAVRLDKVPPGTPIAVTLQKGAAIEGTVRDGATGAPLARVVVEAREDRAGVSTAWDADAGVVRTQSDERGRFRLDGLAVGLHTVSTRSRGFDTAKRRGVRTGVRVDLYLFPGSALVGVVRDAQGQPVPKAIVRASAESLPIRFTESALATSDAEGRFEIPGLETGTYRLIERAADFALGLVPGVAVENGSDAEADVVLYRGSAITGRLVGPNEKPVSGRVSMQEADGQPAPWGLDDVLATEAGPDGRFRLAAIAPGSHALAVVAPGYASQRIPTDVGSTGVPVDLGDIVLETGLAIRGRVRDRAGSVVAGAQINGFSRRGGFGNMATARAEADGSFVIAGLWPGTYRLTARAPGYGEETKSVEAGGEGVADFVLSAAGAITGLAVDEGGRPVDSFRVTARPVREESGMRFAPRSDLIADADGRFRLEDVAEATYVLLVAAPDRAEGVVSNVKVPSGGTVDVGRVRLGAGGSVRGTVTDVNGAPIMGAAVRVLGSGYDFIGLAGEVASDAGGAFELRGLPAGTVQVSAQHPNYAKGRVSVEVDPAKGPTETRVVLSQGGRVEGSVRRRDGTGVPDVVAQVTAIQPGAGMVFPGESMVHTAADGTFAVDHIPVGRANVTLPLGSAGRYQSGPSKEVDVREGEVAFADFVSREILVSGRVTRGGAPAPNLSVSVHGQRMYNLYLSVNAPGVTGPPSGPQRGVGVSREDGSYELLVDTPGPYTVGAATADGRLSYPGRQVEIPDADTFVIDLAFSGVPVAGVVVERETEQPVNDANVSAWPKERSKATGGGATGGGATTGADGRFLMELEPGEYELNAHAEGYGAEPTELTVGAGGTNEVRVTLSRAGMISGRLVDLGGRGVGSVWIGAMTAEGKGRWGGGTQSLPDGSYQLTGVAPGTYNLSAQSPTGGFAVRTGVTTGQKDATLTLRPGGQVRVLVQGPDGAPVEGVSPHVSAVDGARVSIGMNTTTDAQGTADMMVPAGQVELTVRTEKQEGKTTLGMPAGGSLAAEITLADKPSAASP